MSDKSGGFFSSMGRFFSGGSSTKSKEPVEKSSEKQHLPLQSETSPSASAAFLKNVIDTESDEYISDDVTPPTIRTGHNLRYLSPSALERRDNDTTNGLEIDVEPASDIFFSTPSVGTSRKRQLTELDKQLLPQSFRSDSVKRSRGVLNRSLLEPTLRLNASSIVDKRLDQTWCGELAANHSPASSVTNFSLLTRRSETTTNGSLSSRTQQMLKKLEGANTPAKEIQRMSMLRPGLARPEKWGNIGEKSEKTTESQAPPLKKAADAIPSRIQLISKSMAVAAQRTPYWRDLTRKRAESTKNGHGSGSSDTHSLKSLNGCLASTELSSVFTLDAINAPPTTKKSSTESSSRRSHVQILKGPDGKVVGRNTFKLTDEDDADLNAQLPPLPEKVLSNPQPLKLAPESAPKRGFLDNLSFTFSAPVDVISTASSKSKKTSESSEKSEKSAKFTVIDSDSDDGEKASSESSESSEGEEQECGEEEEEEKTRPHTSADTISTAAGSNNGSSSCESSKDSSPEVTKKAPEVVKAPEAPASSTSSSSDRKPWDCPDCFVSNKATDAKCPCCGHEKYKSADGAASSNPFGANAFKPTSTASTMSFGFGGSSASAAPKFGLSTAPASSAAPPAAPISFGAPKPATEAPEVVAKAPEPPKAPVSSDSSSSDRKPWDCPDCFVSNKATDAKCPCCGHEMYKSAPGSTSNPFGANAFKPLAPSSTSSAISFGFGASAPSSAPKFGLSAAPPAQAAPVAPAAPPAPVAPVAPISAPAPILPKPTGSLFGNLAPAVSAAPTTSTVPLFGSTAPGATGNLFGAPKPTVEPVKAPEPLAPKPSLFGTAQPLAPAAQPSLFSSPSLFGASKPVVEAPKVAPAPTSSAFSFGASTTTTETAAAKPSIFGSIAAPPAPLATSTTSLFGSATSTAKPADSTTAPSTIFGKPIQFGSETTTTDGGAIPAKRGMFSLDSASNSAPKLTFGGPSEPKKMAESTFGGFSSQTSSLFGPSSTATTSAVPSAAPSLFGANSTSSIPPFGSASSTAAAAPSAPSAFGGGPAGGQTIGFGAGSFGGFGAKTTQPGMSTSSSTNSLFGAATADSSSNPFALSSSTGTNGGFNFGGASSSTGSAGGGVFQFGQTSGAPAAAAPAAAPGAPSPFQFGTNLPPAPGSMDNAFTYQAPSGTGGARKMALARRRNIRNKTVPEVHCFAPMLRPLFVLLIACSTAFGSAAPTQVDQLKFSLKFSCIQPDRTAFDYRIYVYDHDVISPNDFLISTTGTASPGTNNTLVVLVAQQDGDESLSDGYKPYYEIWHTCTSDAKDVRLILISDGVCPEKICHFGEYIDLSDNWGNYHTHSQIKHDLEPFPEMENQRK
ncbi:unnamed protein product [Caenorhabditis sp. 36 PRJEB53466]|nr:unnamed protein product [Caenorhabditis sp. 36 PRJEB53466]